MTHYLFTDGSYNPHLNMSSIGGYLLDENKNTIFEFSEKLLDKEFLKYHELAALKYGLIQCLSHNVTNLICYADDISLRNLNYLEVVNSDYVTDPIKKNLLEELIVLRKSFDLIKFRHIKRKFNKKADKLASSVQLDHFYDNIFFKERYEIDSKKLLTIPNLVCLEDYYNAVSTDNDIDEFKKNLHIQFSQCDLYLLLQLDTIDDNNGVANLYSLDKHTQAKSFIALRNFDIKKVNSHCLDLLDIGFKDIHSEHKPSLGLIILSDNLALKKFDMLLRKRFLFPKIKTPLVDRFLSSCDNLSRIVLVSETPDFLTPKIKKTLI